MGLRRPRWPLVDVLMSCATGDSCDGGGEAALCRTAQHQVLLRIVFSSVLLFMLTGCQIHYLMKSAISQADLLMRRVPIDEAIKDPNLTADEKRKLQLALEARQFAETELGLKVTKNYTSYVKLDRPYVTYVVSAAPRTELTPHLWHYPLVGSLPYRGYFNPDDARKESDALTKEGMDSYVRGVSAFSTLGWFRDPVLSSMLAYQDHDLVNTIIHETVHATLYIKSEADFNERLATFIGNKGTEMFYRKREGDASSTLGVIRRDNEDEQKFSAFISDEIGRLKAWYEQQKGNAIPESERRIRLEEIQLRFRQQLRGSLEGNHYKRFETGEINNARLLTYQLYLEDLSDFEAMYVKLGSNFDAFLKFCKDLERVETPAQYLAAEAHRDVSGRTQPANETSKEN